MVLRIDGGDLVATEAKYYSLSYLAYGIGDVILIFLQPIQNFSKITKTKQEKDEELLNERTFLEFVDWMKAEAANRAKTFPMAELSILYDERREQFNITS